ncbi:MAG: ribonuclease P protein component [Burkholderiaceae bacterium]
MARSARSKALASEHFQLSLRRLHDAGAESHPLWLGVPKKLLKRAVDRNTLRRVARESWRAASRTGPEMSGPGPVLLRLVRRPASFAQMPQSQRKRAWRAELDALFTQAVLARSAKIAPGIARRPTA